MFIHKSNKVLKTAMHIISYGTTPSYNSIEEEFDSVQIGDERLNKRMKKLALAFWSHPNHSIAAACKGKSEVEAAYRFFDNPLVTHEKVLESHINATKERIKQHPIVSCTQDTTEMWHYSSIEGLGDLNEEYRRGYFLHPTIAFTLGGVCLGVIHSQIIVRNSDEKKDSKHRNQKDIEDKESFRWLASFRVACQIAEECPDTRIVSVGDCENDIYECIAEAVLTSSKNKADIVIRGRHDRLCEDIDDPNSVERLKAKVSKTPILTEITVRTSKSIDDKPRDATVNIRAKSLLIKAPSHKPKQPHLQINIVLLEEVNPPKGIKPICWVLLTTLPIDTMEEIFTIIKLYVNRFKIEVFFRTLKSGCKVEEVRLETIERVLPCLALYMIVAWRIMFATMLGRDCPELPCTALFDEDEWQSVYVLVKQQEPPEELPTLGEITMMIARLGGHIANSKKRVPGAEVMWRGLTVMRIAAMTRKGFKKLESNANSTKGMGYIKKPKTKKL